MVNQNDHPSDTERTDTFKLILSVLSVFLGFNANAAEKDYYKLTTVPFPKDLKLEVSGMAALPGDRMAIAIRKGEVWIAEKLSTGQPVYKRFASGLHEPLGLALQNGDLYTVQRSELTRLRDTDSDGSANEYLTHAKGWGVTGNYHEYAYGPAVDGAGNLWVALNCSIGKGLTPTINGGAGACDEARRLVGAYLRRLPVAFGHWHQSRW